MQYTRIYSEKNGDSRFAEADLTISEPDYQPPAPTLFVSHTYDASGLQFVRLPGGWTGEALHPPARQFVICVDGHLGHDGVEFVAIIAQEATRLCIALVGDAPHLVVHGIEERVRDASHARIALSRQDR